MGSTRVDEPLITINAMVNVGPWTVEEVRYGKWRHCDRCDTAHKEVWVCTIDAEVDDTTVAARLNGQRTWLVGSTCGPTLELVSDHNWAGSTKDLKRIVKLAVRATHVVARAHAEGYTASLLPMVAEALERLKKGALPPRMHRRMSSIVRVIEQWLERKAESARTGMPVPPQPWTRHDLLELKKTSSPVPVSPLRSGD